MSDDTSPQDFEELLKKMGIDYTKELLNGKIFFKVQSYVVPQGKYAGKVIGVGFAIPTDFPTTAPYGIHVRTDHGFQESIDRSDNPSDLGPDWRFWSRQVSGWSPGTRNSQYFFDQVNRWFDF
ncbi:MAG: E2/UBC family protein [Candidatus Nitrosotenuis sp.]